MVIGPPIGIGYRSGFTVLRFCGLLAVEDGPWIDWKVAGMCCPRGVSGESGSGRVVEDEQQSNHLCL